ncbi:MAG: AAC(3) family N-acetyltransferase [Pseudomonadota bacterium]
MTEISQTASTLASQLAALGVKPGMTLMVHASFSKVGWTEGGPRSAVQALFDTLGQDGTLVMPSASPQLSPSNQDRELQPTPDKMFDSLTTPTTMGALAECFRIWPETLRSDHPLQSVCANGRKAREIVSEHSRVFCEGYGTPYEKLYTLDAHTLLLGVGFNRCTSLHFAEFLSARRRVGTSYLPILQNGQPKWLEVQDMDADNSTHFPTVGDRFASTGAVQTGKVGQANSLLFSTRALVEFATAYFDKNLDPKDTR